MSSFKGLKRSFVNLAHRETIESGYENLFERDFDKMTSIYPAETFDWINTASDLYAKDEPVLSAILYSLSHMPVEKIQHPSMFVYGCLTHVDVEVQEHAIGVIEHWRDEKSFRALLAFQTEIQWLGDYVAQMIQELKEELHID